MMMIKNKLSTFQNSQYIFFFKSKKSKKGVKVWLRSISWQQITYSV